MRQRCQLRSSFIAGIAAVLLAMPICAHAGPAHKGTTTLRVALTGSFFLDTDDQSSSEWIAATSALATVGECTTDLGCAD